jgi:hypothetical protein
MILTIVMMLQLRLWELNRAGGGLLDYYYATDLVYNSLFVERIPTNVLSLMDREDLLKLLVRGSEFFLDSYSTFKEVVENESF